MYLAGTVVALGSLTQEMACSSPFNDKYFLSLTSLKSGKTFRKNSNIAITIQCTVLQLKQIGTLPLPDDFFLTFFESVFTNVGPTLPLACIVTKIKQTAVKLDKSSRRKCIQSDDSLVANFYKCWKPTLPPTNKCNLFVIYSTDQSMTCFRK